MSTNVKITRHEDTLTNLRTNKRAKFLCYATDSDLLIYFHGGSSTERRILLFDINTNATHDINSLLIASDGYVGLGASAGRIVFNDDTDDTISIVTEIFQIGETPSNTILRFGAADDQNAVRIYQDSGNRDLFIEWYDSVAVAYRKLLSVDLSAYNWTTDSAGLSLYPDVATSGTGGALSFAGGQGASEGDSDGGAINITGGAGGTGGVGGAITIRGGDGSAAPYGSITIEHARTIALATEGASAGNIALNPTGTVNITSTTGNQLQIYQDADSRLKIDVDETGNATFLAEYNSETWQDSLIKFNSALVIQNDGDAAVFEFLKLTHTDTPASTETVQALQLGFYLTQSINGGASEHEAARIHVGKDSDWFHTSTEADTNSFMAFYTTLNGSATERARITSEGALLLRPGGNSYNEGIRILPSTLDDYASIAIGAVDAYSGTGVGQWNLIRNPVGNGYYFSLKYNATEMLVLNTDGTIRIPGLAGTGSRAVVVDANGVLSAPE